MFCIHCGTKLPEEAKFCFICGAPVSRTGGAKDGPSAPQTPPAREDQPGASRERNWLPSGKGRGLAVLPGLGVAFLQGNLFLWDRNQKRARKLTEYRTDFPEGLGAWNGKLYLVRERAAEQRLEVIQVDPRSGEREIVTALKDAGLLFYEGSNVWFQGQNCWIAADTSRGEVLVQVNLEKKMCYFVHDLPDINGQKVPDDWMELLPEQYPDGVFQGERWFGLTVHGKHGYLSVLGATYETVQISLQDGHLERFLPIDTCCADSCSGMLCPGTDIIVGLGALRGGMHMVNAENRSWQAVKSSVVGGVRSQGSRMVDSEAAGRNWWRMGKQIFLCNLVVDFTKNQVIRVPFSLLAEDFIRAEEGGVYVLGRVDEESPGFKSGLYWIPENFLETCRSAKDAERLCLWRPQ